MVTPAGRSPRPRGRRRARRLVAALVGVAALAALAACADEQPRRNAGGGDQVDTGPPPGAPRTVTPEAYGAVGDGRADDSGALEDAFADLRPGDTLVLAAGRTYTHGDVLEVTAPGTVITGPGALLATDEEDSSLQVLADDVEVRDVVLRIGRTTRRWDAPDQHRLVIGSSEGVTVTGVDVQGSAAAGIFVIGARDFRLTDVRVADTRADGIHMTGGAADGTVERPVVARSGDDGVAVVSYRDDRATTSRIRVESPRVSGVVRGRGVSVVGGEDVVYRDVQISDTYAAGVYVATEGSPYYTRPTRRVAVLGGSVRGANRGDDIDHGALLVVAGSDDAQVDDVLLTGLTVTGTGSRASAQVGLRGDRGSVDGVRLDRLSVDGGGRVFNADTGRGSWSASEWLVDGRPVEDVEALEEDG